MPHKKKQRHAHIVKTAMAPVFADGGEGSDEAFIVPTRCGGVVGGTLDESADATRRDSREVPSPREWCARKARAATASEVGKSKT